MLLVQLLGRTTVRLLVKDQFLERKMEGGEPGGARTHDIHLKRVLLYH